MIIFLVEAQNRLRRLNISLLLAVVVLSVPLVVLVDI
jgi:hypothetical protein